VSVWDLAVGQERAVEELTAALARPEAMTHAWLLTGPPGSGRSVAARAFAAALQCPDGGCGECTQCKAVLGGSHPDVTTLATKNVSISVAQVRELVAVAARSPAMGRWRVIIIEDADRMAERTSNLLLKSIEEPAPHTVWVLSAPSPRDVLVTVRSRCRGVSLRIPSVEAVTELLVERDGIDPERARLAALAAQCHIGMARRLALDAETRARREQVLGLPGSASSVGLAVIAAGDLVKVADAEAKAQAEERESVERKDLLRALGVEDSSARLPPSIRSQIRAFDEDSKRRATRQQRDVLDRALVDLLSYYRDVLVLQTGARIELINAEHVDLISETAATSRIEETITRLDVVEEARTRLAGNVAPALTLEAMAIALAFPDLAVGR
jgi:DNA polymerase-3 subunit delta'